MCFHTALAVPKRSLAKRYNRQLEFDYKPLYHISAFAHAETPVVTADEQIQQFRWGLIPFWTHDLEDALTIRNQTINARGETIFTKPSFREPIRKRRCLIPATGFFDWRHEPVEGEKEPEKIPYYISVKDEPIFSFAGIYDVWYNKATDEKVYTYSIITTDANELMRYIHNTNFRMPVILHPKDEETWLDPNLSEDQIESFLKPLNSQSMDAYTIGNDFLRKSPFDASILERVTA